MLLFLLTIYFCHLAQKVWADSAHPQKYLLDKNPVYVNAFVTE